MKIGFVVLAHDNVFRLRQVVRYLANSGAPIAFHLDKKVSNATREMLHFSFANFDNVKFVEPISCDWGDWSIVEATIRSSKLLMAEYPDLDYIQNVSGTCLPVKSVKEMSNFLEAQPNQPDHIESHSTSEQTWIADGLHEERTTLYHPFKWRKSRVAFDLSVKIQRLLHINRKPPQDIEIRFGSQWWCLSTKTLKTIFDNPLYEEFVKFFKSTWIPDECFFQTLTGHFSKHIEQTCPTYSNFDHMGKPFIFYDDHLELLTKMDRFFVRKVWQGADKLYDHFLNPYNRNVKRSGDSVTQLNQDLESAKFRATQSRTGLISQFRYPTGLRRFETRNEFHVLIGLEQFRRGIETEYKKSDEFKLLGHIFRRRQFPITPESDEAQLQSEQQWRDYVPEQFLVQKIWRAHPQKIGFWANIYQLSKLNDALTKDPNCHVFMVEGAWLLGLANRNISNLGRLSALSKIEMNRENKFKNAFKRATTNAQLTCIPVGDLFGQNAMLPISKIGNIRLNLSSEVIAKSRELAEKLGTKNISLEHLNLQDPHHAFLDENVIDLQKYKKIS